MDEVVHAFLAAHLVGSVRLVRETRDDQLRDQRVRRQLAQLHQELSELLLGLRKRLRDRLEALREYLPDSRAIFDKNPDWYDADKVKLDGIVYYMIFEYASQLAQFRTGALDTMEVAQEDVLVTKRDNQKLLMLGNTEFDRTPFWLRFGYLPGSPFRDERVRKAVSMSTDTSANCAPLVVTDVSPGCQSPSTAIVCGPICLQASAQDMLCAALSRT